MTGTELAKQIHNAVTEVVALYGRALETIAAECAALRVRGAQQDEELMLLRKEKAAIAEALPPGPGMLLDRVRVEVEFKKRAQEERDELQRALKDAEEELRRLRPED